MKDTNRNTIIIISLLVLALVCCCLLVLCGLAAGMFYTQRSAVEQNEDSPQDQPRSDGYSPTESPEQLDEEVDNDTDAETEYIEVAVEGEVVIGDLKQADVVMVEWIDYNCPHCLSHWQKAHQPLIDKYVTPGEVAIVVKAFPLQMHGVSAYHKATVSKCVYDLGGPDKFHKFHNLLFEKFSAAELGTLDGIVALAATLELDEPALRTCAASEQTKRKVDFNIQEANDLQIYGTPTFLIARKSATNQLYDGGYVNGNRTLAEFSREIEAKK